MVQPVRNVVLSLEDLLFHETLVVVVERKGSHQERVQNDSQRPNVDLCITASVPTHRAIKQCTYLLPGIASQR